MKKSLINGYTKNLETLLNDKRITFDIVSNLADKCHVVVYWCKNQVLHNFTLFNDSLTVNCDNLINDYLDIMAKHPVKQGDKQLFSLRYASEGYCSLAITDANNLELFGVSHKRISKKLADYLFNEIAIDRDYHVSDYSHRYNTTFDFLQTILFKI